MCKYELVDGVYYMVCEDGKRIPVDIDAPPMFRATVNKLMKEAKWITDEQFITKSKETGDIRA